MAELYSQYGSGTQFLAGAIAGSANGVSGLNPLIDRVNSMSADGNVTRMLAVGSTGFAVSGTNMQVLGSVLIDGSRFNNYDNFRFDFSSSQFSDDIYDVQLVLSGAEKNFTSMQLTGSSDNSTTRNSQGYIEWFSSTAYGIAGNDATGFIGCIGTSQSGSYANEEIKFYRSASAATTSFTGSDYVIFWQAKSRVNDAVALFYTLRGTPGTT